MSLHTDHLSASWSTSSPETVSDCHSRRPINQKILESLLRKRIDGSATEEKNIDLSEEKHALEYRVGDSSVVTKCNNDDEKAMDPPLPVSRMVLKTRISSVPLCAVLKKRQSEEEDEDIQITIKFKKPRGRSKQLKNLVGCQNSVEDLRIKKLSPASIHSPSEVQTTS